MGMICFNRVEALSRLQHCNHTLSIICLIIKFLGRLSHYGDSFCHLLASQGPLFRLPAFQMEMIKWDGMHIVNLGSDLWICGSLIKKLLQYDDVFGGSHLDEGDRLLIAYDSFKSWARRNKIQHLF